MSARGRFAAAGVALGLLGCGGVSRQMRGGGEVQSLAVRQVEWNPGRAEPGRVAAVADAGDDVLVLGERGALFFRAGNLVASDPKIASWRAAAALPAADRQATWLVGIDGDGRMYRAKARSAMEPISDRYGVLGSRVTAAAGLGGRFVGLALAGDAASRSPATGLFAFADGRDVTTFREGPTGDLVGGGGKAAWLSGDRVRVFDPSGRGDRFFALPGVVRAALDSAGRLYAATRHEVYAEDAIGRLTLVYETVSAEGGAAISGLVVSGSRVWFAEGADLGVILERQVSITTGLRRSPNATLAASSSGDVWSLADGALSRFAVDGGDSERATWQSALGPVFERACASCHGAFPSSGIDLSSFEAWERRRAAIRRRVIEIGDMPPPGHLLEEADRKVIDEKTPR